MEVRSIFNLHVVCAGPVSVKRSEGKHHQSITTKHTEKGSCKKKVEGNTAIRQYGTRGRIQSQAE